MIRNKSLTYFTEQAREPYKHFKVIRGEDVYTTDSYREAFDFMIFMQRMGFYCNGPFYSDPLCNFYESTLKAFGYENDKNNKV